MLANIVDVGVTKFCEFVQLWLKLKSFGFFLSLGDERACNKNKEWGKLGEDFEVNKILLLIIKK